MQTDKYDNHVEIWDYYNLENYFREKDVPKLILSKENHKIISDYLRPNRAERAYVVVTQNDNYGFYIDKSGNPVASVLLQLNGHDRFTERDGNYFNYVQPYQHHSNTPTDGLNMYSFSLNPEEHQPSGTCNMSRIDNATLNLTFGGAPDSTDFKTDYIASNSNISIYATNYNVLRIMSGMGGLAYSN